MDSAAPACWALVCAGAVIQKIPRLSPAAIARVRALFVIRSTSSREYPRRYVRTWSLVNGNLTVLRSIT
jgi:hypothetical protein